jgi:hypothetical protein
MKEPTSFREKTLEDKPTKETHYRQRKASYLPTDLTTPSGRAQFKSTFASFSGGAFLDMVATISTIEG